MNSQIKTWTAVEIFKNINEANPKSGYALKLSEEFISKADLKKILDDIYYEKEWHRDVIEELKRRLGV
jgi:hypothetical protein